MRAWQEAECKIERRASDKARENVFAQSHVYVLISMVIDPDNFPLVVLQPFDLLDDLAKASREKVIGYR